MLYILHKAPGKCQLDFIPEIGKTQGCDGLSFEILWNIDVAMVGWFLVASMNTHSE